MQFFCVAFFLRDTWYADFFYEDFYRGDEKTIMRAFHENASPSSHVSSITHSIELLYQFTYDCIYAYTSCIDRNLFQVANRTDERMAIHSAMKYERDKTSCMHIAMSPAIGLTVIHSRGLLLHMDSNLSLLFLPLSLSFSLHSNYTNE